MLKENGRELANTLFFASAGTSGVVWLTELEQILSIVAAAVAIVAGCVSIYMHCTRRKKRREDETNSN